jgi:putative transposase
MSVIRRQGYRFQLKPTNADATGLRQFLGSSRFVWNELLALNNLRNERGESRLHYNDMAGYLVYLKEQYPFLREVHSQPLQQTLRDLDQAYERAFSSTLAARLPVFKKKHESNSIRFPQGFKLTNNAVYLPKLGWIGFRRSRNIVGTPKNVTVLAVHDKWYVTIQVETEVAEVIHPSSSKVGIDLGVARFAALSDGSFVDGVNAFQQYGRRLAVYQRRLARKEKFSANWRKSKSDVGRVQAKIARIRDDMLHKASTIISKNHALIVMEDLQITNMTASVKGTVREPGKAVAQKSGLNRRILDQGWGEFRRQISYKSDWAGGHVILVDPRNTSRTCSSCAHLSADNRQTQSIFECVSCGYTANADTNAAINILRRAGQARIACGGSQEPKKQEALYAA